MGARTVPEAGSAVRFARTVDRELHSFHSESLCGSRRHAWSFAGRPTCNRFDHGTTPVKSFITGQYF